MTRTIVNGAADVVESHGKIPCEAGEKRVSVAERYHACREHIAILIYKTLTVPEQKSIALQAFVQEIGIVNVSVSHTGVENLDILVKLQTIRDKGFFNLSFTANQNGSSQSCCRKAVGGADHT